MRNTEIDGAFSNPRGHRSDEGVREAFLGEVAWWLNVEVFEDVRWGRGLHVRLGGYPRGIFGDRKGPVSVEAWRYLSEQGQWAGVRRDGWCLFWTE